MSRSWTQSIFGGKPPDPKEQVKQWRLKLKGEMRTLQIDSIGKEEDKIIKEIKKCAKDGQMESAKMLAREVARSRKAKERILIAKTNLNSLEMKIGHQMATMRVVGTLEKSSEVMKMMNEAVKIKDIAETMREMSKEMQKAGIIDEMMNEAFEDMDDEGVEEDADIEVDKVLADLGLQISGALVNAKPAAAKEPARPMASTNGAKQGVQQESEDEEDDPELVAMQARIAALR